MGVLWKRRRKLQWIARTVELVGFRTPWRDALILKVLGKKFGYVALRRRLQQIWNPKGELHQTDPANKFYNAKFSVRDDRDRALSSGPWTVQGTWYRVYNVEDEGLDMICVDCGRFGHKKQCKDSEEPGSGEEIMTSDKTSKGGLKSNSIVPDSPAAPEVSLENLVPLNPLTSSMAAEPDDKMEDVVENVAPLGPDPKPGCCKHWGRGIASAFGLGFEPLTRGELRNRFGERSGSGHGHREFVNSHGLLLTIDCIRMVMLRVERKIELNADN
ncbi:hypothetical protein CRG98_043311 [Punica granatum]|uniref:DUF4283 domain-containing protein n=1 Tax=Punica granatum TaxID=22663 RepID=A0A2I0HX57_PUNGR|nr:hypothetical protein CRG98_043311 [Punica granatum]